MKISNPAKKHCNLNVRILFPQEPTPEASKEVRDLISKALYAEGYQFLVWETESDEKEAVL